MVAGPAVGPATSAQHGGGSTMGGLRRRWTGGSGRRAGLPRRYATRRSAGVAVAAVAGGLVLTTLTGLALAGGRTHLVQQGTLTSVAVADTTVTTSAADLENGNRPTLTTCPQPCTGETAGEREARMKC